MAGLAATFGRGAMTNHWIDIKNANCIFIIGANPCENHPGVMRWINDAIDNKSAKVVVADPRKTRTATIADIHLQIRPGTDIALIYGMLNHILGLHGETDPLNGVTDGTASKANIETFLERKTTAARAFFADDGTSVGVSTGAWPKYTDALFKVNSVGTDYQRETKSGANWNNKNHSNVPVVASSLSDTECVYYKLTKLLEEYTPAVAADICGVDEDDIKAAAEMIAKNSTPDVRSNGNKGDGTASGLTPKVTTLLYAMGGTQHTYGSQIIRAYALFQTMLGNMGKFGGGINAMRGIHNVQGSTDMGLLYGNIPGYSGPPTTDLVGTRGYIDYIDGKLFGKPYAKCKTTGAVSALGTVLPVNRYNVSGIITIGNGDSLYISDGANSETVNVTSAPSDANIPITALAHDHAAGVWVYNESDASTIKPSGLQQAGFDNILHYWFSSGSSVSGSASSLFDYFPKGNGRNHVEMFQDMTSNVTDVAIVWGQNPAVTEPNLSEVKQGLIDVDTLVVVDQFYTETAAIAESRLDASKTTYVIPACSFAEKCGSQTNSGRWIQWRNAAIPAMGGSRADLEILLNLAKALDTAGAFDHIISGAGNAYTPLYGANAPTYGDANQAGQYGYTTWLTKDSSYMSALNTVAENVFKQLAKPQNAASNHYGTLWIYKDAYTSPAAGGFDNANRAKSRVTTHGTGTTPYPDPEYYPNWGWAWLVNRRIFYNSSECGSDVGDVFVNADVVAQLFTGSVGTSYGQHAYTYRYYRKMSEIDDYTVSSVAGGRFPKHWEPIESPKGDLVADNKYGRNTHGTTEGAKNVPAAYATRDPLTGGTHDYYSADLTTYPYVLTTIRCTEHFQGGPTTRNIPWLNELVNEPWIEINETDAATKGISNGDSVKVMTMRDTVGTANGTYYKYKAVVTTRVKQGVVAIPWHWGKKGLSPGASANYATMPAGDANTTIPEYKACLCNIQKV